ncbi:MAG: dTMP kinase [Candidatus Omnitrophica bacterium]|nr:dTMP kinase [Candidatus Omnitrophota bacterium]MCM8776840.1 dTMP kinase [Candidatus Omnitrophota bacterium]
MYKKKGIIVSFEGIDGCGKSTQARLFCEYLDKNCLDYVLLNEPGGTYTGEKIRKILLDSKNNICPLTELFLYLASRSQLVEELIIPYIKKGKIVVLDRYIDSTTAYQGYGRGISLKLIRYIHSFLVRDSFPDITFLIDAPASELLSVLKNKKRDRIEKESLEFQKKVRDGYLHIARQEKKRIKVIKRKTVLLTHKEIIKEWGRFIDGHR